MSDNGTPPEDDYEVGYKRPPKHTRFAPGRSGNPRGRPRKSKQLEDLIEMELDEKITVKEGGRETFITKREAIVKQFLNRALKGDPKALQLVLAHLEKHRDVAPFVSTAADDAELLKAISGTNARAGEDDGDG